MFGLHLKIALRNFLKRRSFSWIILTGLSLGIGLCMLLYFYCRYEMSFDQFQAHRRTLYRLEMTDFWDFGDPGAGNSLLFPFVTGEDLRQAFPEIRSIDRIQFAPADLFVRTGDHVFKERRILFSDTSFFTLLSFPLLKGDPAKALSNPNGVVISESTAKRYFGNADPIGKTIAVKMDTVRPFSVTGVVRNAPDNSSLQFDLIFPNSASPQYRDYLQQGIKEVSHVILLDLASGASPSAFQEKLNNWQKTYFSRPYQRLLGKDLPNFDFGHLNWYIRLFVDAHYTPSQPWGHYTNVVTLYLLGSIATVILLIASLNYVLMALAVGSSRAQEVSIRKVMGASRVRIAFQFCLETQLIVLLACCGGLLLTYLLLPVLNSIVGEAMRPGWSMFKEVALPLPIFGVLLGLAAGLYPAIVIAGIDTNKALRRAGTFRMNPTFGKIMVIFQFTSCVILILSALTIRRQMDYITKTDLGFDRQGIVMIHNQAFDLPFVHQINEQFRRFAASHPYVLGYSPVMGSFDGTAGMRNGILTEGRVTPVTVMEVGYGYFKMLKIQVERGRVFDPGFVGDTSGTHPVCVVNETLFRLLGKSAHLDAFNYALGATIVGIVRDYHFDRLSEEIQPLELMLSKGNVESYFFKIESGHMQEALEGLKQNWEKVTQIYPFEYSFLDQKIAQMYTDERRWQRTILAATIFAIFISCMGLFGLSAITVGNYKKDIGIRKVLGAGLARISFLLVRNYLAMVLIAVLIGSVIGLLAVEDWLRNFAYRTTMTPILFFETGGLAILIALFSIAYHVGRIALLKPVESLRSE
jgi:putative ABC transport system permease protein